MLSIKGMEKENCFKFGLKDDKIWGISEMVWQLVLGGSVNLDLNEIGNVSVNGVL